MSDPERGPEQLEHLQEYLEFVRVQFDPEVHRIAQTLKLSEDDVAKLAVILLGQQLDMTNDPDTLVLVVRGSLSAYDTALEALLSGGPGDGLFGALVRQVELDREERGA